MAAGRPGGWVGVGGWGLVRGECSELSRNALDVATVMMVDDGEGGGGRKPSWEGLLVKY